MHFYMIKRELFIAIVKVELLQGQFQCFQLWNDGMELKWHPSGVTRTRIRAIEVNFN